MALGLGVGVLFAVMIGANFGLVGVPWLMNLALAKLGLIAAGGLMAAGAGSLRLANRREEQRLLSEGLARSRAASAQSGPTRRN